MSTQAWQPSRGSTEGSSATKAKTESAEAFIVTVVARSLIIVFVVAEVRFRAVCGYACFEGWSLS